MKMTLLLILQIAFFALLLIYRFSLAPRISKLISILQFLIDIEIKNNLKIPSTENQFNFFLKYQK